MTAQETLIAAFERMGIKRHEGDSRNLYNFRGAERTYCVVEGGMEYKVESKTDVILAQGNGYGGFYAKFRFNEAGELIDFGCFE